MLMQAPAAYRLLVFEHNPSLPMARDPDNLIWIDLEMTGLRPDVDHIIEIATLVTDKHLNVARRGARARPASARGRPRIDG